MGPTHSDLRPFRGGATMGTTTMVVLGIFLFGAVALIGYFIMLYNGLISLKENIKKSWSNIDVILKQRHDELPKLISVCESFAEFEKGVLEHLVKARQNYMGARGVAKKAEASGQITAALGGVVRHCGKLPGIESQRKFHAIAKTNLPSGREPGGPQRVLQRQHQQLQYPDQTDPRRVRGRDAQLQR